MHLSKCNTNLEIFNGNFGVSLNVFAVLITDDTGDKVRTALLLGDSGTGGEFTVGNELASVSIILSNSPLISSEEKFVLNAAIDLSICAKIVVINYRLFSSKTRHKSVLCFFSFLH